MLQMRHVFQNLIELFKTYWLGEVNVCSFFVRQSWQLYAVFVHFFHDVEPRVPDSSDENHGCHLLPQVIVSQDKLEDLCANWVGLGQQRINDVGHQVVVDLSEAASVVQIDEAVESFVDESIVKRGVSEPVYHIKRRAWLHEVHQAWQLSLSCCIVHQATVVEVTQSAFRDIWVLVHKPA
jgi:hypothetical protein